MEQPKRTWLSVLLLVLASMIWGSAFVAQQVGMDYIGPYTFTVARNVLAIIALTPLLLLRVGSPQRSQTTPPTAEEKKATRRLHWRAGLSIGLLLAVAQNLQQMGLLYTTPGKAGFITAFYIVLVPIFLLFRGRKQPPVIWVAAVVAFVGLFLLTINETFDVGFGEVLVFLCAVIYAFHILAVEHYAAKVNFVALSAIQFLVVAVFTTPLMLYYETPTLTALLTAWRPLVFTGVFSSAVAYTLQIVGQRHLPSPVASLIFSLEASFAVLAGWLFLQQTLTLREAIGSLLMFAAVILAQLPGLLSLKRSADR